jgi:hypothetical protein
MSCIWNIRIMAIGGWSTIEARRLCGKWKTSEKVITPNGFDGDLSQAQNKRIRYFS